ncbi:Hypothetical protein CINCED_3A014516 [Cinara cedri]|uniref:Uncharacterized protein n=1 Tax=Cinara cedri TaxID=506608 RepID=A0A5E4N139_9HEMI|nr:Hypothetical protein CINCED_3A014516 [Cinara cedri]
MNDSDGRSRIIKTKSDFCRALVPVVRTQQFEGAAYADKVTDLGVERAIHNPKAAFLTHKFKIFMYSNSVTDYALKLNYKADNLQTAARVVLAALLRFRLVRPKLADEKLD